MSDPVFISVVDIQEIQADIATKLGIPLESVKVRGPKVEIYIEESVWRSLPPGKRTQARAMLYPGLGP